MHPLIKLNEELAILANLTLEFARHQWPNEPVDFLQRRALRTLRDKGSMSLSGLARERGITRQHARKLVRQLKEIGYATCQPNPRNRRSCLAQLTEEGLTYINQHDKKVSDFLFEHLQGKASEEEIGEVFEVMHRVRRTFDAWVLSFDN